MNAVSVHPSWKPLFVSYFETQAGKELRERVHAIYTTERVFPPPKQVFAAFNETPLESVRIVILGQDPYHGTGQAHGFSFSVPEGMSSPPSLENIYKEIESDIGSVSKKDGNLVHWARQGVLLLNAMLTVRAHSAASHRHLGWEGFTDIVIGKVSDVHTHCVFLLWGAFAKQKERLIDTTKHLVLKAPHPSPLSAHNGFFGCQHFSQTNRYIKENRGEEIMW